MFPSLNRARNIATSKVSTHDSREQVPRGSVLTNRASRPACDVRVSARGGFTLENSEALKGARPSHHEIKRHMESQGRGDKDEEENQGVAEAKARPRKPREATSRRTERAPQSSMRGPPSPAFMQAHARQTQADFDSKLSPAKIEDLSESNRYHWDDYTWEWRFACTKTGERI